MLCSLWKVVAIRQQRFRARLSEEGIDAVIITDYRDIYYLTGRALGGISLIFLFPALLYLETDGRFVAGVNDR